MNRPSDHPALPKPKIGLLLINLGTPDAPEARAVRRYLAEFLSDPRVIEIPKLAWKPILHGIILRTRPKKSAEAYNQIWTNEGSPLRAIAHRQADALRARLPQVNVHYAMRYGHPGIAAALENMTREGCTRILVAPLYPQYSAATTATANDAVFGVLARMRWQPAIRTLPPYYDDPLYIGALATNLARQMDALDFTPERLLLSFHGRSNLATRIIVTARRPRGCFRKRSGGRSTSHSNRASAARNGSNRRPTRRLPTIQKTAFGGSLWLRLDFPPTVSRLWRSSGSADGIASRMRVERSSRCSTASTIPPKASPCSNA
jgi:hypothetical protein